jgi:hypothetical protein
VDMARLRGAVAVGNDVFVRGNRLRAVTRPKLRRALPNVAKSDLCQVIPPVVADRSWNVPSPHLRAGFPRVLLGGSGIDEHGVSGEDRTAHFLE